SSRKENIVELLDVQHAEFFGRSWELENSASRGKTPVDGFFMSDAKAVLQGCDDHWTFQGQRNVPVLFQTTVCVDVRVLSQGTWTAFSYVSAPAPRYELALQGDENNLYAWLLGVRHQFTVQLTTRRWYHICLRWDAFSKSLSLKISSDVYQRTAIARAIPPSGRLLLGCQPNEAYPGVKMATMELYLFRIWDDVEEHKSCEDGTVIVWDTQVWAITRPQARVQDLTLQCASQSAAMGRDFVSTISPLFLLLTSITSSAQNMVIEGQNLQTSSPATTSSSTSTSQAKTTNPTGLPVTTSSITSFTSTQSIPATTVKSTTTASTQASTDPAVNNPLPQSEKPTPTSASQWSSQTTQTTPISLQTLSSFSPGISGVYTSATTPNLITAISPTMTQVTNKKAVLRTMASNALFIEPTVVQCDFSQYCTNESAYYWMLVDVSGSNLTEKEIQNLFLDLFQTGTCSAGFSSSGINATSCQTDAVVVTADVACEDKQNIQRTNCTVLLELKQFVNTCILSRLVENWSNDAPIQIQLLGNVEIVGKGLCPERNVLPPRDGFVHCSSSIPHDDICKSQQPINISSYKEDGFHPDYLPPKQSCYADSQQQCVCYGVNNTGEYYAVQLNIENPNVDFTYIQNMVVQLRAPCDKSVMTGSLCNSVTEENLIQGMHLECFGDQTRLYTCMLALQLAKQLDVCAVSNNIYIRWRDSTNITFAGPLKRIAICNLPTDSNTVPLNSTFTWITPDQTFAVLLKESCVIAAPESYTTQPNPLRTTSESSSTSPNINSQSTTTNQTFTAVTSSKPILNTPVHTTTTIFSAVSQTNTLPFNATKSLIPVVNITTDTSTIFNGTTQPGSTTNFITTTPLNTTGTRETTSNASPQQVTTISPSVLTTDPPNNKTTPRDATNTTGKYNITSVMISTTVQSTTTPMLSTSDITYKETNQLINSSYVQLNNITLSFGITVMPNNTIAQPVKTTDPPKNETISVVNTADTQHNYTTNPRENTVDAKNSITTSPVSKVDTTHDTLVQTPDTSNNSTTSGVGSGSTLMIVTTLVVKPTNATLNVTTPQLNTPNKPDNSTVIPVSAAGTLLNISTTQMATNNLDTTTFTPNITSSLDSNRYLSSNSTTHVPHNEVDTPLGMVTLTTTPLPTTTVHAPYNITSSSTNGTTPPANTTGSLNSLVEPSVKTGSTPHPISTTSKPLQSAISATLNMSMTATPNMTLGISTTLNTPTPSTTPPLLGTIGKPLNVTTSPIISTNITSEPSTTSPIINTTVSQPNLTATQETTTATPHNLTSLLLIPTISTLNRTVTPFTPTETGNKNTTVSQFSSKISTSLTASQNLTSSMVTTTGLTVNLTDTKAFTASSSPVNTTVKPHDNTTNTNTTLISPSSTVPVTSLYSTLDRTTAFNKSITPHATTIPGNTSFTLPIDLATATLLNATAQINQTVSAASGPVNSPLTPRFTTAAPLNSTALNSTVPTETTMDSERAAQKNTLSTHSYIVAINTTTSLQNTAHASQITTRSTEPTSPSNPTQILMTSTVNLSTKQKSNATISYNELTWSQNNTDFTLLNTTEYNITSRSTHLLNNNTTQSSTNIEQTSKPPTNTTQFLNNTDQQNTTASAFNSIKLWNSSTIDTKNAEMNATTYTNLFNNTVSPHNNTNFNSTLFPGQVSNNTDPQFNITQSSSTVSTTSSYNMTQSNTTAFTTNESLFNTTLSNTTDFTSDTSLYNTTQQNITANTSLVNTTVMPINLTSLNETLDNRNINTTNTSNNTLRLNTTASPAINTSHYELANTTQTHTTNPPAVIPTNRSTTTKLPSETTHSNDTNEKSVTEISVSDLTNTTITPTSTPKTTPTMTTIDTPPTTALSETTSSSQTISTSTPDALLNAQTPTSVSNTTAVITKAPMSDVQTTTSVTKATTSATTKSQDIVANDLLNKTQNVASLNSSQVNQLVNQLENLLSAPNISLDLGRTVLSVINNFLNSSADTLGSSSNRLIKAVDDLALKLVIRNQTENLVFDSLALTVSKIDGTNFGTTSFSIADPSNPQVTKGLQRQVREVESSSSINKITLPASLTENLSPEQQKIASRVQFTFYQKNTFFQDKSMKMILNSNILGSSVANLSIKNLKENVEFTLTNKQPVPGNYVAVCVFWDFDKNEGLGGWNKDGCSVQNSSTENETICSCNHLTSFAVLLDISQQGISDHLQETILTFISFIGCGVSAIFISVTLITYLAFEKIRHDIPSKILIHLCFCLLLLNLVFLLDSWLALYSDAVGLCISTAFFLHYFLLVSFTWMGLEALHMYLAIVKVFNNFMSRYMLKFSLIGWGVPLVVVIIVIAIDKDNYGLISSGRFSDGTTDDFCWLKNKIAFYVAVVAYFCIIFVLNLAMFVVVMVHLRRIKRRNPHNNQYRSSLHDFRSVAGLTILLGLTWGFAFFAWGPVYLAFTYLFTIFNSLQGFFIFLFHCALKENVRKQWRMYLCCGSLRLAENSEWSRTATQSHNTKKTSIMTANLSNSGSLSPPRSSVSSDNSLQSHGIGSPIDDSTIMSEETNEDVVYNEINSQLHSRLRSV
ncbi:hypothetical protein DNTS_017781, partial [Danionella cerebrum]